MLLEANQLHRLDRLAESEISSRVCGESSHSDDDGESSSAPSLDSSSNISAELPEEDRRRIMFGLTRGGLSSRIYWALKLDLLSDEEDDEEELESDWESGSDRRRSELTILPLNSMQRAPMNGRILMFSPKLRMTVLPSIDVQRGSGHGP